MTIRLKEMFHQSADSGIPSHWVVQYYVDDSAFPDADYFSTEAEAKQFADEITLQERPEGM